MAPNSSKRYPLFLPGFTVTVPTVPSDVQGDLSEAFLGKWTRQPQGLRSFLRCRIKGLAEVDDLTKKEVLSYYLLI